MSPQQKQGLETLIGRALTEEEIVQIDIFLTDGNVAAIANYLPSKTIVSSRMITERGVRALPVLPRSRFALLDTLRSAENTLPAWFIPTITAMGVPTEDHVAMSDDLQSAWRWLTNADGLDIGTSAARSMLDLIAFAVPNAAQACAEVKRLAENTVKYTASQVSDALEGA